MRVRWALSVKDIAKPYRARCLVRAATGASQWEPPEWFDEMDPNSGATYYRLVEDLTGYTI
jgi:hypothetical protein